MEVPANRCAKNVRPFCALVTRLSSDPLCTGNRRSASRLKLHSPEANSRRQFGIRMLTGGCGTSHDNRAAHYKKRTAESLKLGMRLPRFEAAARGDKPQ